MPTILFPSGWADMRVRGSKQSFNTARRASAGAALLLLAGALAGCATTGDDSASAETTQMAPITDSAVVSDSLPPIGGADGSVQVANADPAAAPSPGQDPVTTAATGTSSDGAGPGNAAVATVTPGMSGTATPPAGQGSFVSLNDVGHVSSTPGRDLAGGLSVEKLLGGWTVSAGDQQCRLNLTYTAADSPERYRASSPGCQIQTLSSVSSWQLSGTQVQLFNDANALVGTLLLSGNRFVGTLAGGQAVSMVG